MRTPDERNMSSSGLPTAEQRTPAYSAEQREILRRGLRIMARMIVRAHLQRLASRSGVAPSPPAEREDGD